MLFACNTNHNNENYRERQAGADWPTYGGNPLGNRYSPLRQINRDNVGQLQLAWTYDARDDVEAGARPKSIQCQPIIVDGVLYGTSPELNLFALDAATGAEKWKFFAEKDPTQYNISANRGVLYWEDGEDRRILYTSGAYLYAIDAITGQRIESFGQGGKVDLHTGLADNHEADISNSAVNATSPGVIYQDKLIIGSSLSEKGDALPGHVRAFNVRTGELLWVFHTIPHPGETGYDTWPEDAYKEMGGANNWGGMSLDSKRGVVYFGTGSPSSDFYGGNREGENLFGNSVVALDANNGELKWYFQTIMHDLWDRDHPSPPNLSTIEKDGNKIDVVVQATKDGLIYVLDRDSGESLFPIEEKAVPTSGGLAGEHPWPVQKYPSKPAPLSHQVFTEDLITERTPEANKFVRRLYEQYRTDHKFSLPSEKGTLMFGYSGGAEWGGNAIDTEGILYQNANNDPWILEMANARERKEEMDKVTTGKGLYEMNCAMCHGADRKGSAEFPGLEDLGGRLKLEQLQSILLSGAGRMPSFRHLKEADRQAIAAYILDLPAAMHPVETVENEVKSADKVKKPFGYEPAYVPKLWRKLRDPDGYPGIIPPWGTLNAIDLASGDYLWRVPLGEYPELAAQGLKDTGSENYGGPLVTAGGLVFIAGTMDEKIRAFDKDTGQVVWEYELPAAGFATPATYEADGKQYLVIAAGGGRGRKPGGYYVAFAL